MFKILKIAILKNEGCHCKYKSLRKQHTTEIVSKRETINALRPFYLLVHPDFFVQHPSKRAINESSLQKLNSYLEALHCSTQIKSIQPTKVEFYSKTQSDKGFNLIQFTLYSKDVATNIQAILAAFNLPNDNIKTSRQIGRNSLLRDNVFYEDMFYDDVAETRDDYGISKSLSKWLSLNINKCRKEQEACSVILASNEQIKDGLCMLYGIREIQWLSTWQHTTEQGSLKVLARTCKQHTDFLNSLQGRRLVFTDRAFPASDESICLNVEDVPLHWMQFISEFDKKYSHVYKEIDQLENYIQQRLGNMQIRRPKVNKQYPTQQRIQDATQYLKVIRALAKSLSQLKDNEVGIDKWALRDNTIKITVDSSNSIMLSERGDFLMSYECSVAQMLKFISENHHIAREQLYCNAATKRQVQKYKKICYQNLNIKELTKDWNVSNKQMLICCEKLCNKIPDLPVDISGLKINITLKHYNIFNHGKLGIPWDWKD